MKKKLEAEPGATIFYLKTYLSPGTRKEQFTTLLKIIKGVMSSAAEAELGAMYINARKAVKIRIILEEMGHKQPATPVQVDNSTAEGIVNKRVQPKRSKAMDMCFHWLRDRSISQKQF
jgi:hypothetical protein